jgi:predicted GNAT family acetyltransferase
MKEEYRDLPLKYNEQQERFELEVDGTTAYIEYRKGGNTMALTHTEVPAALEGKGVGTAIVEKSLSYLEENNYRLVPLCPFVLAYVERHPEWKRLMGPGN